MTTQETRRTEAELLSALMDDELSADERRAILQRLDAEPELQMRWARYHAARAAMNMGAARLSPGFTERVRQAREQEPAVLAPGRAVSAQPAWLRPVAGVAISASVALVAIGGLTLLRDSSPVAPPTRVAASATSEYTAGGHDPSAVTPVAVSTPAFGEGLPASPERRRLMLYLASHSEYADVGEMPTVIPFGRLSSINAGQ